VNSIATAPIRYASATIPADAWKTLPKIPIGAITTMNTKPYAMRSGQRKARGSSCR
jgi:hypothetical protein